MKKIRVGVIGVGAMGKHHARVYSDIPFADLVGVADVNEDAAKTIAQKYKTQAFKDYEKLLAEDLDAVSIAVPTTLHKDVAIKVADYGIDMLIEKPIADSIENAKKIIKVARRSGSRIMVGHIERFNPAVLKLKDIIISGKLGDVLTISCKRVGPYSPRIRDVGIIIDLAVHDIDSISYLYDDRAENVYAVAGSSFHKWEDYASLIVRFKHNKVGMIETNWLTPKKVRTLTAVGTGGVATLDYINQSLEISRNDKSFSVSVVRKEPLRNELEIFLKSIMKDVDPKPSGEDGLYVLAVAIAAINSYKSGVPIRIHKSLVYPF